MFWQLLCLRINNNNRGLQVSEIYRLYAVSHSLFAGRARSYLIKQRIPFKELSSGHESFKHEILPLGKKPTIPTLATPEGAVVRDGAEIIEHFERVNGYQSHPSTPKQNIVSLLFDVIGAEGLLRAAMHYRWNFPETNLDFLTEHFMHVQRDKPGKEEKCERMMDRMRHVAQLWGVNETTMPVVEAHYCDVLDALQAHFSTLPYLLGGKPCIGDYGMIAPLFAHLGRDPYPLKLMQDRAIKVYRWVERMNRPDQDAPEFFYATDDWLDDDDVPDTLLNVLKVIAEDFVPETLAQAEVINAWLASNVPESGAPAERMMAPARFDLRGQTIEGVSAPYRFYLLQRVQDAVDALSGEEHEAVLDMLGHCGMRSIVEARLTRRIRFVENEEVWV